MNPVLKKKLLHFLLVFSTLSALAQQSKPNIVWITIEDTSPDFIGCYGNTQVKTPNIDALAAEGIRFTNAHSTNTVCAPSRHTIITGLRTAADGCGHQRSTNKIPAFVKGFPYYLKKSGYFTSNNHKTDYNIDQANLFIEQNWNQQGGKADFINRLNKAQPFFAVFNVEESHQSRTMSNSYQWYTKNVLKELLPEEVITPQHLLVPPFYRSSDSNQHYLARLYNSLQVMDKKVGAIIQKIKVAGEWENTIVFFFADHGQGMPRFKTNVSRLATQVPFIIRLPEKFKNMYQSAKNKVSDELINFEDLAPTIIALSKGEPPTYMKGRIFLGPNAKKSNNIFWGCRDNVDEVIDLGRTIIKGDFIYERIYYPHLPMLQREVYFDRSDIVRQMRADFNNGNLDSLQASIFRPRSAEYLFNLKTDKWETQNLATDKRYFKLLAEMRKLNKQKIQFYNDLDFLHQTVLAQINKVDTLLVWKERNYRVAKYLNVAEMVGMGRKYLSKQSNLLWNKDSIIRYWAVVGLRNQSAKDLDSSLLIKAFEKEKSDFVKIELSDLLFSMYGNKEVLHWAADLVITSSNSYLVRQAAMKFANFDSIPSAIAYKLSANMKRVVANNSGEMSYAIQSALTSALRLQEVDE